MELTDGMPINPFGQPIGEPLAQWTPREAPSRTPMAGRFCCVEALDPGRHADGLRAGLGSPDQHDRWTYLPYGPFQEDETFDRWLQDIAAGSDPLFYSILDPHQRVLGLAAYMRIDRSSGVIEVGHLNFSDALKRTPAATEAMFLMMRRAFDELGYRRYEWKCDSLNEPSRRAALRLGFTYEGLFRQAVVYKQRSRDTTWYSITDGEWPSRRTAFEAWLDPANFDTTGAQRQPLSAFMPPPGFRYDRGRSAEDHRD